MIFCDRKSKKSSLFISNLNDTCSQLSFEMYTICMAQKLQIWDFRIFYRFFFPGPWPLRRPPKTAISTSATSIGYQILAEYVRFHIRSCLLVWNENGEGLDYVSQNGWIIPPPRVFNWPKSPGLLGLICLYFDIVFLLNVKFSWRLGLNFCMP